MLHGERVTLRPYRREDLPKVWEFRTNVEVKLAGGGDPPKPITLQQVEGEFEKREFIFQEGFAIEADGNFLGYCGLYNYNQTARNCEIGITIGETGYWSKGYGREVMRLLVDYGFRLRNVERIWLSTQANNERAIRCYLACGFVEEGRLRKHAWSNGAYHDVVFMGILREEWEGAGQ
jgi:RimJ/RimL family protein N-acetyltransferase